MDSKAEEKLGFHKPFKRERSVSYKSSKQQLPPLMASDSGLYTDESTTSDYSFSGGGMESDTDSMQCKYRENDFALSNALQDVTKLRSELERLTKSEQWYRQELKQQKTNRLDDLERIYTKERKYLKENQRLQKECVRLYEKCNELELDLEQQKTVLVTSDDMLQYDANTISDSTDMQQFELQQQNALIADQQQLISLLRNQKHSLLQDLRHLNEEKNEKVIDMQKHLADLELDNKRITQKCLAYNKDNCELKESLESTSNRLSSTLEEKQALQKSIENLQEQLQIQEQLVEHKETEIQQLERRFKDELQQEQDLDEVHRLSLKYHDDINKKSMEIITLKTQLHQYQEELNDLQALQQQNDKQQREIEQLQYILETYRLELNELKQSECLKSQQLEDLQTNHCELLQRQAQSTKLIKEQQCGMKTLSNDLNLAKSQHRAVQDQYEQTKFQLDLMEIERKKFSYQSEQDQKEILELRAKLREYLKHISKLSEKIKRLEKDLRVFTEENSKLTDENTKLTDENLKLTDENSKLMVNREEQEVLQQEKVNEICESNTNTCRDCSPESTDDSGFTKLMEECNILQNNLDKQADLKTHYTNLIIQLLEKYIQSDQEEIPGAEQDMVTTSLETETQDEDLEQLSQETAKLNKNLNFLKAIVQEKFKVTNSLAMHQPKSISECMDSLVIENVKLKKSLTEVKTNLISIKLKEDLQQKTQKCTKLEEKLSQQQENLKELQSRLLKNDAELYKMQRHIKASSNLQDLKDENYKLKQFLSTEQNMKTDLQEQLLRITKEKNRLSETLHVMQTTAKSSESRGIQTDFEESDAAQEVLCLKEEIQNLKLQQKCAWQGDCQSQQQRIDFIRKLMDIQNAKLAQTQDQQKEWEDMLQALESAQKREDSFREELEFKRMELEDLNLVFEQQNEQLKKLEGFLNIMEQQKQRELTNIQETFHKEVQKVTSQLEVAQKDLQKEKQKNHRLSDKTERIQEDLQHDHSNELALYKKDMRSLQHKMEKVLLEKESLMEYIKDMAEELKELRQQKREAMHITPNMFELQANDNKSIESIDSQTQDLDTLKSKVSEDHLRLLTKVLEGEYQRKMLRYDEHIHSLLNNVKSLKKSLKQNEQKCDALQEEQQKTIKELEDLQKTKTNYLEIKLKYEQSQDTIKNLREELALEKQKFESSDLGKSAISSTQSRATSTVSNTAPYEASNLIDDYKKLIQQSAIASKRPQSSIIMELIQRSNQCVPNLNKLETNINDLSNDLQKFINDMYAQQENAGHGLTSTFITAASLSVPPSLLDELRAAQTEGY